MPFSIRHASTADQDIEAIVDYIAAENLLAALGVGDAIETTSGQLGVNPHLGERFVDPRVPELRRLLVSGYPSYSIYYQVLSDEILIVRVLHNSRDIDSAIATPP